MVDYSYQSWLTNNTLPGPGAPAAYDPGLPVVDVTPGNADQYSSALNWLMWIMWCNQVPPGWLIDMWWSIYNQLGGSSSKAQLTALTSQLKAGDIPSMEIVQQFRDLQARLQAETHGG